MVTRFHIPRPLYPSPSVPALPSSQLKKKKLTNLDSATPAFQPTRWASPLRRQVTRERAQRTPLGLQRYGMHAALPETVPELVQARQRSAEVTASAAPEHLSGRGGARPHYRIKVLRAGLLSPEQLLPAEHEGRLRGCQVREWVECVGLCDAWARCA
jgi:hypothetical protein